MIKSPLNYVGGKFKLLPQILPYFPKEIDTFVDVFGGGFNVGININSNKSIYNDTLKDVVNIMQGIYTSHDEVIDDLEEIIEKYDLSRTNKDGYLKLREDWNSSTNRNWKELYMLIVHAFNNQIRFNKKGEYNMPFGKDRSDFNPTLRKKFHAFRKELISKDIDFMNVDFEKLPINKDYFYYCDPPYSLGVASYNENGGWTDEDDVRLFAWLDKLHESGCKFALSNVIEHKNLVNENLIKWTEKYNVKYLNYDYSNCNYHKLERANRTIEVLITNY